MDTGTRIKWYTIIGAALLTATVVVASCSRTIEKPTQSDYPIDTPPTPLDMTVMVGDQVTELRWSEQSGVAQYRIYRADTTATDFELYDSTETTSYIDRGVSNNVIYFYRLASVNGAGVEGGMSPAIAGRPGIFSVAIEDDREYVNSLNVTVQLTAPTGTNAVRLASSADFTGRPWVPYAASRSWELPPGDGVKTAYAEFRDVSGAVTRNPSSDDIVLDTRAIIDSVRIMSLPQELSVGDSVLLLVATSESGGSASAEVAGFSIECFDDGTRGDDAADDGMYYRRWQVPEGADFESETVVARFTDRAGNDAETENAPTLLTVRQAPDPVTAFAFLEGETSISISWTQTDAEDFAFYRVFRDTDSDVGPASDLVFSTSSPTTTTYADTGLEYETQYYYAVVVYDDGGLSAISGTVSVTTDVNAPPAKVDLAEPIEVSDTQLRLTWTPSDEGDFSSYRVLRRVDEGEDTTNGPGGLISIIYSRGETDYTDGGLDLNANSYTYWVKVVDRGDSASISDPVSRFATPDTGIALDSVEVTTPRRAAPDTSSIQFTWQESKATNFQEYRIYRSTEEDNSRDELLAIISSRTTTSFTDDDGDFKETQYYYWVVVYDTDGNSKDSVPVVWNPPE